MQVNYQYEVSILYSLKVLEKVKTEQKQYTPEINKSGGPAGHQVRILWGPAKFTLCRSECPTQFFSNTK